jgi:hypothetical protein
MWSSGPAGATPAKFQRGPAAGTVGDGRGSVMGLLGTGFGRSPGRWGSWRTRVTAAAAAGRGMPVSSEPPAGARELAARSTTAEGRGGPRTVARSWKSVGSGSAAAAMERGGRARSCGRRSGTRGEGDHPL